MHLKKNTSFVGYTENGFNIDNHINLFNFIHKLTETNKKIMLSNSDVSLIHYNFSNEKYNITSILCKRTITPTEKKNKRSYYQKFLIK